MESNFIESLYTRFILRDFLGKIVPGSSLVLWVAREFTGWQTVLEFLQKLPVGGWILGLGLGWLTGLGVQSLGECTRLFRYWPRHADNPVAQMVAFDAKASDGMRHQVERLRVMKEACGTAAIVFLLALVFTSCKVALWVLLWKTSAWSAFQSIFLEWCVAALMFGFLQRMHLQHVDRQARMMSAVLDYERATAHVLPSTRDAQS